jgi:predicted Na+-dependent transporter
MTNKANGNAALTVAQSTIGNILGPFVTTALIKLYISTNVWYTDILPQTSSGFGETYRYVFKQLGLSVFVPLVRLLSHFLHVSMMSRLTGSCPQGSGSDRGETVP